MLSSKNIEVGSICIYVSMLVLSNFLSPLFIPLFGMTVSAGTFSIPIAFAIIDALTNFDKKTANSLILWGSVSESIFAFSSLGIAYLAVKDSHFSQIYQEIAIKMAIGSLGFFIAMIAGQKINSKIFLWLAKNKSFNLLSIKNYAGRSIISSAIGESVYIMIVFPIAFYKDHTLVEIFSAAVFSLVFKIIMSFILAQPSKKLSSLLGQSKNPDYSCARVEIYG